MIFIPKILVQFLSKMFNSKKRKNTARHLPTKKPRYEGDYNPSTDMVPCVDDQVPRIAPTNQFQLILAENNELKRKLESCEKARKEEWLKQDEKMTDLEEVSRVQFLKHENIIRDLEEVMSDKEHTFKKKLSVWKGKCRKQEQTLREYEESMRVNEGNHEKEMSTVKSEFAQLYKQKLDEMGLEYTEATLKTRQDLVWGVKQALLKSLKNDVHASTLMNSFFKNLKESDGAKFKKSPLASLMDINTSSNAQPEENILEMTNGPSSCVQNKTSPSSKSQLEENTRDQNVATLEMKISPTSNTKSVKGLCYDGKLLLEAYFVIVTAKGDTSDKEMLDQLQKLLGLQRTVITKHICQLRHNMMKKLLVSNWDGPMFWSKMREAGVRQHEATELVMMEEIRLICNHSAPLMEKLADDKIRRIFSSFQEGSLLVNYGS